MSISYEMPKLYCDGRELGEINFGVDWGNLEYKQSPTYCDDYYRMKTEKMIERVLKKPVTLWFEPLSELEKLSNKISKVVFNDPATIIIWKDGSKTVVKTQGDEVFDKEKGFLMAVAKKLGDNKGNYNNVIKKWCE